MFNHVRVNTSMVINPNDMAKIIIKCEQITPLGRIFRVIKIIGRMGKQKSRSTQLE